MAGVASLMGAMMQTAVTISGVIGGPLLGLFTLDILCPFANSKIFDYESYLYFSVIGTVTAISVRLIVSFFTGGWRARVDSRLTLMKEDTTSYHLVMFFKGRVTRRAGKPDLTNNGEKKVGNTSPAFCDTEMDLTNTKCLSHSF